MYLADIFCPQYLHFPFRNSHENTGIKSIGFSRVLQLEHCEGGFTIDTPAGIL
jgi:hypothetical protein